MDILTINFFFSFLAKDAFTKLGEDLKLERQKDFFQSFSHMYENEQDPADINTDLLQKLQENRLLGDAKLSAVFEEHCKLQDEKKASHTNTLANTDDDTEEENKDDEDDDYKKLSDIEIDEGDISDSSLNTVEFNEKESTELISSPKNKNDQQGNNKNSTPTTSKETNPGPEKREVPVKDKVNDDKICNNGSEVPDLLHITTPDKGLCD